MLCTGCGTKAAVVGQFCDSCDNRARNGFLERRRSVGGSQWQALWGISYADAPTQARRRRRAQGGAAMAAIVLAVFLVW